MRAWGSEGLRTMHLNQQTPSGAVTLTCSYTHVHLSHKTVDIDF